MLLHIFMILCLLRVMTDSGALLGQRIFGRPYHDSIPFHNVPSLSGTQFDKLFLSITFSMAETQSPNRSHTPHESDRYGIAGGHV